MSIKMSGNENHSAPLWPPRRNDRFGIAGVLGLLLTSAGIAQPFTFTQPAGPVRETNAVLRGMVVPNGLPTTAWFEWGTDANYGQVTASVDLGDGSQTVHISTPVINIQSGPTYHYRAVSSNSLGVIYGENQVFTSFGTPFTWGQLGSAPAAPASLSNVVAIAAGNNHCLALKVDGSITGWGNNSFGKSIAPADLTNALAIAAGASHSLALTDNGIIAWGLNTSGETNVPPNLTDVVQIAAGGSHSLALNADGTVVGWGLNSSGQTNVPVGLSNVVQVAAGTSHSLALKADGTVAAWGLGSSGQTNVPVDLSNIVAVAAANLHSLALKRDGTIIAWGSNVNGVTNVPALLNNITAIAGGMTHGAALTRFGSALTWSSSTTFNAVPARPNNTVAIAAGNLFSVALQAPQAFAFTQTAGPISTTNATLNGMITPNGLDTVAWFEWGTNGGLDQRTETLNIGSGAIVSHTNATIAGLVANAVYEFRVVASNLTGVKYGETRKFTTGRRIATWGRIAAPDFNTPVPPAGLSNVVNIAAGDYGGLAVVADGTITTWGLTTWGFKMGNPPAGLSNIVGVAGGRDLNVALKADRTVLAWQSATSVPINLPAAITNVVAISAGDTHGMTLRANGTLAGWGGLTPLTPPGVSNVVAISSGDTFCLALKNDGTVTVWGTFDFGQVVAPPTGLRDVIAIAAGYQHALALRKDGTVVAWGFNNLGQLDVPPELTNVVAIASGDNHCLALKSDGTVVIWGSNVYAQQTLFPAGLNDIVTIASGDEFCMVLGGNTPPRNVSRVLTGRMNQDFILNLTEGSRPVVTDPNGDQLICRIVSPPLHGSLFQFTASGRGEAITTNNTPVIDPLNRVIFAPAPAEYGAPYTTFTVVGHDGEFDSPPAVATLNILPAPVLTLGSINSTSGAVVLSFTGLSNVSYNVWVSTNLATWTWLGTASQPSPEQFLFTDANATNWPQRFYQIRAP
jgi:alpha-tubulin suppressor-like RCC1 family protein